MVPAALKKDPRIWSANSVRRLWLIVPPAGGAIMHGKLLHTIK